MGKQKRTRIDKLLFERSCVDSRERAQRLILAGQVLVDERVIDKPGRLVSWDAVIRIVGEEKYVSRGGYKLEAALDFFGIDVKDLVCLDVEPLPGDSPIVCFSAVPERSLPLTLVITSLRGKFA